MSRRGRTSGVLASAVVAVVIVVAGLATYRWHAGSGFAGSTRESVNLAWVECMNDIAYTDPDTQTHWLVDDKTIVGQLETAPRTPPDPSAWPPGQYTSHAAGSIHFDTSESATFTSRAGGSFRLTRQPPIINRKMPCVVAG